MDKNNRILKPKSSQFLTRLQISERFGVSSKTIKRYIDRYRDDILIIDTTFKDRVLISPKVVRFLYEKFIGDIPND